jgi:hypothetical protein
MTAKHSKNRLAVWHGTTSGESDAVAESILRTGLFAQFNAASKNMQEGGVFFLASKKWARWIAEGLINPDSAYYHGPGKAVVARADFVPDSDDWDLDYEFSYRTALDFLKIFRDELEDFPVENVRIVVTKANLRKFSNAGAEEKKEILSDWTMTAITMKDNGPVFHFRDNLHSGAKREIPFDWTEESKKRITNSVAAMLEQVVHHYRQKNPVLFRSFLSNAFFRASRSSYYDTLAVKYTGERPLPVQTVEIKNGDKWRSVAVS